MFHQSLYRARRTRLKEQVRSGLILLPGNEESPMNCADNPYHFRQDSSFLYFFGLDHAGLAGVVDLDEGTDTIYGDDLTLDDFVWTGPQPALRERALKAGVETTGTVKQLEKLLGAAMARNRTVHFLPPYRAEHALKLQKWLGIAPDKARQAASVDLIRAIVDQRAVKGPEEVEELDKAVSISVDMHVTAMRMVKPGITEADVAAAVHRVALAAGGNLAFPIIGTIHGETLHNHYHGNRLKSGDMFLLDTGAETSLHYAGDLSSTMPVDLRLTERQREIYRVTLAAHQAAVGALRPGVKNLDVHLLACKTLAHGLKDLGLMKGDIEEAVHQGAHALFFPCGTGHMLGLDVHDMENLGEVYVGYEGKPKSAQFGLKSLRLARELQPGFVLTVEPGIYFIPQLIDRWRAEGKFADFIDYDRVESYRTFGGIRNEENVLITADGHRILGKPKPKTIEEVEAVARS